MRSLSLIVALVLATAHRLPAPIVESEEKPTPAAQQSEAPKRKHAAKPKLNAEESEAASKRHEVRSATRTKTPRPENKSRCAGVWTGMLNFGLLGNADETLTIDPTGTVVMEKNQFGTATHPATCDGATVRFQSGALNEIAFTLAPNADGQTAIVTANSLFIANPGAAFRKIGNNEASPGVATSASTTVAAASQGPNEFPTAKPVSGR